MFEAFHLQVELLSGHVFVLKFFQVGLREQPFGRGCFSRFLQVLEAVLEVGHGLGAVAVHFMIEGKVEGRACLVFPFFCVIFRFPALAGQFPVIFPQGDSRVAHVDGTSSEVVAFDGVPKGGDVAHRQLGQVFHRVFPDLFSGQPVCFPIDRVPVEKMLKRPVSAWEVDVRFER